MFKQIYDYFKSLFSKQEYSQEFIDQCKPMKEVLKNIEGNKNKIGYKVIAERNYYRMMCENIRFESLKSGHNSGRLTFEEEREFDNMLTIHMTDLRPWVRERIGMRSCYFID